MRSNINRQMTSCLISRYVEQNEEQIKDRKFLASKCNTFWLGIELTMIRGHRTFRILESSSISLQEFQISQIKRIS